MSEDQSFEFQAIERPLTAAEMTERRRFRAFWRDGAPDLLTEGLEQRDGYLAGLGLDSGWLVIFDRNSGQLPLAERLSDSEQRSPGGRQIRLLRL
ncbi:hypothetical protein U5801_15415 [Lamprobacter modestohalophilus]|uniref:Uncharacterized protein n=1 Tax=Lamprobacter modestohalophilus TaxID=1064514 RepID=A0A9X0W9R2_9GAMM|nr:hypothetical protein [Lamprobacter modestohalophilus]MBK1619600.1 hypothetical protein [Lamprobacter modestohalophilus]MEA1051182.1 hypothetical protein [Lamprobacter modestohalophilus]